MIKKLRLYLDTSIISYLDQQDAPERMAETRQLWERIKTGEYDVVYCGCNRQRMRRNCFMEFSAHREREYHERRKGSYCVGRVR